MTIHERWSVLVITLAGAMLGAIIGWFGYDGVDVDV